MSRLRSILGLIVLWLVALGGRHASAQIVVTGYVANAWGVAQTNVPVTFTPIPVQLPRAISGSGGGVMTGTGVRTLTDAAGGYSVSPLPGLYSVQIGALATRPFNIEVGTNAGTFNVTSLATTNSGLAGYPTNGWPLMTGATAGTAGSAGLVPAPAAGEESLFLRGDGTWGAASGGSGDGSYERVEAGTNIGVAKTTAGGTNVFTVSAGSGLATDAEVTTATNTLSGSLIAYANSLISALSSIYQPLSAALTTLATGNGGALTNLVNGPTVTAGANITVNQTTNPNGSKNYEVVGSAGGGSGSYERVAAGTDITVTPSTDAGTNVFTVAAGSGLATDSEVASAISALSSVYQPLDSDLTAWALVNPASYSTTAAASALYQPISSTLSQWSTIPTNIFEDYVKSSDTLTTNQLVAIIQDEIAAAGSGGPLSPVAVTNGLVYGGNRYSTVTITSNTVLTLTNFVAGQQCLLVATNASTHTLTIAAGDAGTTVQWESSTNLPPNKATRFGFFRLPGGIVEARR